MQIRNVTNRAREIAATGQTVEPGDTVDVPGDLGESLCEQPANWEAVEAPKTKAPAAESKED